MIAAKLLGTRGQYPEFEIVSQSHVFIPHAELTWSAVLQPALPEEWEVGEFTPLVPEEVRLFAAITLSESDPRENGMPVITHSHSIYLDPATVGFDLSSATTRDLVRTELLANYRDSNSRFARADSALEYCFHTAGDQRDALELLGAIDTRDQLLLAALARFLGACRLLAESREMEEAAIILFISMGAALEYVRLCQGGEDAPFAKVYDYIRSTFPHGEEVVAYFEEMYEHRLIAIHPSNRTGEFWAPPLMADDVYHLRKSLMGLYRHILLGEITSSEE